MNEDDVWAWREKQRDKADKARAFAELEQRAAISQTSVKATATKAARKAPAKAPRIVADHVKAPAKERARAENCSQCGRAMRPKRAVAAEYPGTVRHFLGGKCWRCCNPPKKMGRPRKEAAS